MALEYIVGRMWEENAKMCEKRAKFPIFILSWGGFTGNRLCGFPHLIFPILLSGSFEIIIFFIHLLEVLKTNEVVRNC